MVKSFILIKTVGMELTLAFFHLTNCRSEKIKECFVMLIAFVNERELTEANFLRTILRWSMLNIGLDQIGLNLTDCYSDKYEIV